MIFLVINVKLLLLHLYTSLHKVLIASAKLLRLYLLADIVLVIHLSNGATRVKILYFGGSAFKQRGSFSENIPIKVGVLLIVTNGDPSSS